MEDWGQFVLIDVSRKNYSYTRLNEIYKVNEMSQTNEVSQINEMNEMNEMNENNKTKNISYIIKKVIFSIFYLCLKITYGYIYNETGPGIDGISRFFSSGHLL